MYQELLQETKEAFAKIQNDYQEVFNKFEEEAKKYRYFDDDTLLSSPPLNRAAYSDRTAWAMASMAELAYHPFETSRGALGLFVHKLDSGGFTLIEYFNVEGTQAFLAHNNIYAVLAFRGTEGNWRDIQSDIRAGRKRTESGKIHAGFFEAYGFVSEAIKTKINEMDALPLYITGHSLGGALATVATQDLEKSGFKDQIAACYTFGSPRVGNGDFDQTIKSPFYRMVNFTDIVTFVPLLTMGFTHVGDVRYLGNGFPTQARRARPLSQRIYFFLSLFVLLWPAIKSHGIKNYVNKLERIALGQNTGLMQAIAMKENLKISKQGS